MTLSMTSRLIINKQTTPPTTGTKTMRNRAKRISSGNYVYRGYRIELVEDFGGFVQWNIFESDLENAGDCSDTLQGAKYLVDRILDNRIERN
jgi:hypothetical protein